MKDGWRRMLAGCWGPQQAEMLQNESTAATTRLITNLPQICYAQGGVRNPTWSFKSDYFQKCSNLTLKWAPLPMTLKTFHLAKIGLQTCNFVLGTDPGTLLTCTLLQVNHALHSPKLCFSKKHTFHYLRHDPYGNWKQDGNFKIFATNGIPSIKHIQIHYLLILIWSELTQPSIWTRWGKCVWRVYSEMILTLGLPMIRQIH